MKYNDGCFRPGGGGGGCPGRIISGFFCCPGGFCPGGFCPSFFCPYTGRDMHGDITGMIALAFQISWLFYFLRGPNVLSYKSYVITLNIRQS